jgi:glycogen debranching enzyme
VLAAAEADLAWLWNELGDHGVRATSAAAGMREALAERWDEDAVAYRELDLHAGEEHIAGTVGELLPLYAGVPDERQARRLFDEALWAPTRYGPSPEAPWAVTTVSKQSPDFDASRYWRGPVWININWFLIRGLERLGLAAEATVLRDLTLELVSASGFSEYYNPSTGAPLGSREFSWSAALTLDLIDDLRS